MQTITRKEFLITATAGLTLRAQSPQKALIVVAHPDDEYALAATTYRFTRELGGIADQVVITNGEGGYRYSALAESIYGVSLTNEREGRANLPAIRKQETLSAGRILGIRNHHFLDQKDLGFGSDASQAQSGNWDRPAILAYLAGLLERERYDFVFFLLPTQETHGHHRAASELALEAIGKLPEAQRPVALGAEPGHKGQDSGIFRELAGSPITRTAQVRPAFTFDRNRPFGHRDALNYGIVVNWVIAEHKSQGLFQAEGVRHDIEQFWAFAVSGPDASGRAEKLGKQLSSKGKIDGGHQL